MEFYWKQLILLNKLKKKKTCVAAMSLNLQTPRSIAATRMSSTLKLFIFRARIDPQTQLNATKKQWNCCMAFRCVHCMCLCALLTQGNDNYLWNTLKNIHCTNNSYVCGCAFTVVL